MKKILLCFIVVLCFTFSASAQISKDSLLTLVSKETCKLLESKDFKNLSKDELELELGLAMMPNVVTYEKEIKTHYGYDGENFESLESFGKDVGMKLAITCPVFLKMFTDNPDIIKEYGDGAAASSSISGTLVKIVNGDFSYLQVKDKTGKIEKIWWLEYFDGSAPLIADPSKWLDKKITVTYVEKEMYNATLKEYIKVKVITGLE